MLSVNNYVFAYILPSMISSPTKRRFNEILHQKISISSALKTRQREGGRFKFSPIKIIAVIPPLFCGTHIGLWEILNSARIVWFISRFVHFLCVLSLFHVQTHINNNESEEILNYNSFGLEGLARRFFGFSKSSSDIVGVI
jgi:hypothetical protein